jgi:TP901 family phage tail tape measure protein
MAEDFLPVGIRAVAKDVDTFVNQVGRMQQAVTDYGIQASKASKQAGAIGQGAGQSSAGITRLTTALNQNIQATSNLSTRLTALTGKLGQQAGASARASAGQSQLASTATQASASQGRLAGAVSKVGSVFTGLTARMAQAKARLEELRASEAQLSGENSKLQASFSTVNTAMKRAQQVLSTTNQQVIKYENELEQVEQKQKEAAQAATALAAAWSKQRQSGMATEAEVNRLEGAYENAIQAEKALGKQAEVLASKLRVAAQASFRAEQGVNDLRTSYKNTGHALEQNSNSLAENRQEIKSTENQIRTLGAALAAQKAALNTAKAAWISLSSTVKAFRAILTGLVGALSKVNAGFKRVIGGIAGFNNKIKAAGSNAFRMGNSIRFLGTSITFLISLPVIGFLTGMTKAAIDFEEAFAGIIRTVDQEGFRLLPEGEEDIRKLTDLGVRLQKEIRNLALEIPIPAAELAKLGEVAGTLGVRGVGNLSKFVEITAKLGATTNVTAEDAARSLGKILGVAGGLTDAELAMQGYTQAQIAAMTESDKFQATLDGLGGIIVDLGNKTIAQEGEILKFALEIAGAGDVMGFTSKQLLEVGAAFSSVGVVASRGRTAFQKSVFGMLEAVQEGGRELEIFATVAGQTAEEFTETWGESSAEAFRRFVEGLGQQGDKAITILKELDLADNRVAQALLALAASEGELSRATAIANEELLDQIAGMSALELEAARRFSTTTSHLQLLKNQFAELGIVLGSIILPELNKLIKIVRGLVERITQLSPAILKVSLAFLGLVAIIGPLITFSGLFLASMGFIIQTAAFLVGTVLSLINVFSLLIIPIAAVVLALAGLGIAFAAAIGKMQTFADKGFGDMARAMFKFGKNIILAFARGMARAAAAVITVLNSIGRAITFWLRPGSPPRLLPDLDKWGTDAMQVYLEGWSKANFDVFNTIADKMEQLIRAFGDMSEQAGKESVIAQILGTRTEIKKIIDEFRRSGKVATASINKIVQSVGRAQSEVRAYTRALIDLEIAQTRIKRIQDEITASAERYNRALKPLNDRLGQISDRFGEIQDAMRIRELEAILADPRATELVREMAKLEIEEIGLESDVKELKTAQDIEMDMLNTRLEAAELEAKTAQERFDAAEATLNVIIKERELLNELRESAEAVKKGVKDALGDLDISDIGTPEVDTSGIDNFGDDLLDSVDDIIDEINGEFADMVAELQQIFAPLEALWDELGETWAPIFDSIFGPLGDFFGVKFANPFEDYILPSEIEELMETPLGRTFLQTEPIPEIFTDQHIRGVTDFGDALTDTLTTKLGGVLGLLIDIGAIKPFGAFAEQTALLEDNPLFSTDELAFTTIGGKLKKLNSDVQPFISTLKNMAESIKLAFVTSMALVDFEGLKQAFANFKEAIGGEETANGLKVIGDILKFVIGASFAVLPGLINGVVTALEFVLPFLGILIRGVGDFINGIIEIARGFVTILQGDLGEGVRQIGDGIAGIITGIAQVIIGIVGGIIALILGFFLGFFESFLQFLATFAGNLNATWAGMWESIIQGAVDFISNMKMIVQGVIDFIAEVFQWLSDELVGGSIVTEMFDLLFAQFERLLEIAQGVAQWVLDVVAEFVELATGVGEEMTAFITMLKDRFVEMKDKAIGWIKDVVDGIITNFADGIRRGISTATDAIGDFATGVRDTVSNILNLRSPSKVFEDIGENTIAGWVKGVKNAKGKMSVILEETATVMIVIMEKAGVALIESMNMTWTELIANLSVALEKFIAALQASMAIVTSIWKDAMAALLDIFNEMVAAFIPLMKAWLEVIEKALRDVLDGITDMLPAFFDIGASIVNSMIEGLASRANVLVQKALGLAREIKKIIEDAYEIGSPSKVFVRIGENLIESWGIGMENEKKGLLSTVRSLASSMQQQAPQARQPASPTPATLPAGAGVLASTSTVNNNTIDMGGQVINDGLDAFTLQIMIEQALENVLK